MTEHRTSRRLRVGITGGLMIGAGIVLMPLPGPGTVIALAGLSVLGREFPRARRLLDRMTRMRRRPFKDSGSPADPSP